MPMMIPNGSDRECGSRSWLPLPDERVATICPDCFRPVPQSAFKVLTQVGPFQGRLMHPYPGKRTVDLIAAGTACLIFAPLAAAIALATWFEDGGPPLFLQTRVGQQRRPFTVFKFRTMRDHQVTRVGRWLRQTGLDELPQFINVCRGEMSVIGPRPLTDEDVRRLGWAGRSHEWRFAARPGVTGLSQLLAGRSASYSRRLERLYLRRQSLSFDLRLIALSFAVNLLGKRTVRLWLSPTSARSNS